MYIIEIIVYTVFGNGEEQSWNKTKLIDEEISDQTLPLKEDFKKWCVTFKKSAFKKLFNSIFDFILYKRLSLIILILQGTYLYI